MRLRAVAVAAALGLAACSGSDGDTSLAATASTTTQTGTELQNVSSTLLLTIPDGARVQLTIGEEVAASSSPTVTGRRGVRVGDKEREIDLRPRGARDLASATRVDSIVGASGTLDVYADARLPEYELLSLTSGDWTLSTVDPVASPLSPAQRQLLADSLHVVETDTDHPIITFDAPLASSTATSPLLDVEFSHWKVTLRTARCLGTMREVDDEARVGSTCKNGVRMDVWSDTTGPDIPQLLDHITPTIVGS
jgi:hypothetical protein